MRLDNDRPVALQVDRAQPVDGFGVAGEQERRAVHQAFPQHDLIRRSLSGLCGPFPDTVPGDAVHLHEVGLNRAIEGQPVPQSFRRVSRGITVLEFEVAEAGLDRLCAQPRVVGRYLLVRFPKRVHAPSSAEFEL